MDHSYIDEHNVADRYVLDTLSADERSRFEEHLVTCSECLDRLETATRWRRALKTAVAGNPAGPRWVAAASRLHGWKQAAMLVAAGLVLVVEPLLWWRTAVRTGAEADRAQIAAAEWQRRYRELAESRSQPPAVPATLPVFSLQLTRGVAGSGAAPDTRIDLHGAPPWIVLTLETTSDPDVQSYRASLTTAQGQVVWSGSGLKSSATDSMALALPSRVLGKGDYVLVLDGVTRSGASVRGGRYSFRVEE